MQWGLAISPCFPLVALSPPGGPVGTRPCLALSEALTGVSGCPAASACLGLAVVLPRGSLGWTGWPASLPNVPLRLVSAARVQAFLHRWLPLFPPPTPFPTNPRPSRSPLRPLVCAVLVRRRWAVGRGAWTIGLGSALKRRTSRGGGGGVLASPVPTRAARCGRVPTRSTPPVVLWCAAAGRWGGRHPRRPRQAPPYRYYHRTVAVWVSGREVGGWRGRCVVPLLFRCRQRAPWPRGQTVWVCCPRQGYPNEGCRCGRGASERGLCSAVCGATAERLTVEAPSLHLSATPLLAVGAGGADVTARLLVEPLRRRTPGGSGGASASLSCSVPPVRVWRHDEAVFFQAYHPRSFGAARRQDPVPLLLCYHR